MQAATGKEILLDIVIDIYYTFIVYLVAYYVWVHCSIKVIFKVRTALLTK
jgi:hypothetical protein